MTKLAKFSNGFIDTYKGTRDVKAGWAIINKATGDVVFSGHSLTRDKAAKTASGRISEIHTDRPLFPVRAYPGIMKIFKRHGYDGPDSQSAGLSWARKMNAERRAEIEAAHTIEIVDVE